VIIADNQMPQFDAPSALRVVRETGLDVPFIVVSGAIGEDAAVALMREGAHDYLLKHNLTRLAPAVAREVAEARNRAARKHQEQALSAQLARSELLSALGHLVGGVAHEVRNPLFGITATMDALEAAHQSDPGLAEITRFTSVMRREIERLKSLMNDLLDYGKPESLNLQPTTTETVCKSALQSTAAAAASAGVTVRTGSVAGASLTADFDRLGVALSNILHNAIQLSPRGAMVTLSASVHTDLEGEWVDFVVEDQGPGVPTDQLARLFEPFFTRRRGGTGLGLAIVNRTITQHRGRVFAQNGASAGAIFTVRLPSRRGDAA
jgi:signal transduction histidine kinase